MAKRAQRKSTNKKDREKHPHGRKTSKGFSAQVPSILRSRPSVGRAPARVEVSNAGSGSENLSSRLRFPQCEPKQRFAISVKSNLSEMTCIILAPGYLRSRDVLEPVAMDRLSSGRPEGLVGLNPYRGTGRGHAAAILWE